MASHIQLFSAQKSSAAASAQLRREVGLLSRLLESALSDIQAAAGVHLNANQPPIHVRSH